MPRNLFVHNAVMFLLKIVRSMEMTLQSSSVSFVVRRLNGSVGEIHTFVSLAIKNNAMVNMCQNIQRISYQNVKALANVQQAVIMGKTVNRRCWVAQFVGITNKIQRVFDTYFWRFYYFMLHYQFTFIIIMAFIPICQKSLNRFKRFKEFAVI